MDQSPHFGEGRPICGEPFSALALLLLLLLAPGERVVVRVLGANLRESMVVRLEPHIHGPDRAIHEHVHLAERCPEYNFRFPDHLPHFAALLAELSPAPR